MAVIGVHALLYSPAAEALRSLLGDGLELPHVDAGHGWLIFALPPAEVAVHPADAPGVELTVMCDDMAATMAELTAKGVTFRGEPAEQRWGRVITMVLPGELEMMLYEPHHPTALNLESATGGGPR